jgi:hypothetical protein
MRTDWLIWGGLLPSCAFAGWCIARRPFRQLVDGIRFDQARVLFRQQREWLEARFLKSLSKTDPIEAARWDDAHWRDEIRWARDRQTHRLLALIGVEFDADPFDDSAIRHATALFEYRKGHWIADGKRVDALRPDEALLRHRRYEPVTPPDRRG